MRKRTTISNIIINYLGLKKTIKALIIAMIICLLNIIYIKI